MDSHTGEISKFQSNDVCSRRTSSSAFRQAQNTLFAPQQIVPASRYLSRLAQASRELLSSFDYIQYIVRHAPQPQQEERQGASDTPRGKTSAPSAKRNGGVTGPGTLPVKAACCAERGPLSWGTECALRRTRQHGRRGGRTFGGEMVGIDGR